MRRAVLWLICPLLAAATGLTPAAHAQHAALPAGDGLPDSPGALLLRAAGETVQDSPKPLAQTVPGSPPTVTVQPAVAHRAKLPPCRTPAQSRATGGNAPPGQQTSAQANCRKENPVQPFVTNRFAGPLDWRQKGDLAFRDTVDPFNLITIGLSSGFDVGINSHSAYGPGLKGWGKLSGYTFVEDAQGEFTGTFVICSLAHEDPRYHRLPNATVKRRVLHALEHTWVSQHDDGAPMPNYSTLLTYPISAELSNLYVPGVPTDLPETVKRVGIGLATDPSGTLVAEFLPDIAKRIHVHVIFIQEILNQVITGGTSPNVQ